MTKTEVKARIKALKREKERILFASDDKECKQIREGMLSLKIKLAKATDRHEKENVKHVESINAEIEKLELELKKPSARSLVMPIPYECLPVKAKTILDHAKWRYSEGRRYSFVWISPKQKYGIMHYRGGSYWSCRTQVYRRSQLGLVDLDNEEASPSDLHSIMNHEGRVSKAVLDKIKSRAQSLET